MCAPSGRMGTMFADLPDTELLERAAELVTHARRIVVLTGAGISTDSGIPDFRGPQGLWVTNPLAEKTSNITYYLSNPDVRKVAWQGRVVPGRWNSEPNDGHRALVALQQAERLHTLVTQNVDGLHQRSGIDPHKVVEVHGTIRITRCWDCKDERPMADAIERVIAGEEDPPCLLCGGILKSGTILFGESLVPDDIDRAMTSAQECDLLLAVGTTLAVGPVNAMVPRARNAGAPVIIVNGDETEMDNYASLVLRGGITPILTDLMARAEFPT